VFVVVVFCETDGAALADAAVAGVIVAPAAGVVLAAGAAGVMVAAGVVLAVAAAGVVAAGLGVVFAAAGLDFVFGLAVAAGVVAAAGLVAVDGVVLGAAFEFLFRREFFVAFTSGAGLLVVGSSAFVLGAVVVAGVVVFLFDFLSGFVIAGVIAGAWLVDGSFTAGVSVFGARVVVAGFSAAGFSAAGFSAFGFLPGASFLVGACDSAGVGSWAITAPASASEATISKLVIFFIGVSVWSVAGSDLFNTGRSRPSCLRSR